MKSRCIMFAAIIIAFVALPGFAQAQPAARRCLIVSVDGLRPDLILRADAPNVRALLRRGSYSFWAQTVAEAYTLPAHLSMLTGVTPARHGVTWNDYIEESYPNVPTIFERAKKAGFTTAAVTGKMKFIVLNKPGTIDWFVNGNEDVDHDLDVAGKAAKLIAEHRPQVMFVHFGDVDSVGHERGWGSAEQMKAIDGADRAIGVVIAALTDAKILDDTIVIACADHGGRQREHVPDDPPSIYIPWIIAGPGIRQNLDLTTMTKRIIRLEDTTATACMLLGIPTGKELDGVNVTECLKSAGPSPTSQTE